MLDQWLKSLSKTTIAVGAIVIGTFLIVSNDPPHSVCDVQVELLKEEVGKYFFIDPKERSILQRSRFVSYLNDCRFQNSSGGCYRFFVTLAQLERELETLPDQCTQEVGAMKEVREAIWDSMELMVRLAWGENGPETYVGKAGWLSPSDVSVYCRTKRQARRLFGEARLRTFQERSLGLLPGAKEIPREESWARSLLSTPCRSYL